MPLTPTSLHKSLPPAVQSTSAIRAVLESLNSSASLSQAGFMDLQWPHHGARNFTNTDLPATAASQVSLVSSLALAVASTMRMAAAFMADRTSFWKREQKSAWDAAVA